MKNIAIVESFYRTRYLFFKWRYSLNLVKKIVLAFGMACVTGVLAQLCFYLPFTPVPVTGQVLGTLLSGVICGGIFGSISQIIYLVLGVIGMPWFAGGASGNIFTLAGSGGYVIGFVFAPLITGIYSDRYISARTFISQLKFMMFSIGIIYLFGAITLSFTIKTGFWETMVKGVLPFIPFDLVKALIAAGLSSSILPKASYNEEVDKSKYLHKKY